MGISPAKPIKQPTRAKSAQQLTNHIGYVNSVIEAICFSKSGDTFLLLSEALNELEGNKFDACIYVYKVNVATQNWADIKKVLEEKRPPPFATLGLDQFARFYDRVHLLAPLETTGEIKKCALEVDAKRSEETDSECMICMENEVEVVLPDCNHAFCKKCLDEWTSVSKTCPMCRSHTESNESLWIMAENPSASQLFSSLSDLLVKLQTDIAPRATT